MVAQAGPARPCEPDRAAERPARRRPGSRAARAHGGSPFTFYRGAAKITTDTELLLFLALTFGLEEDPPTAVARAVGLVEDAARRHEVAFPVQMTVATTDGETTWAFRYSTEGRSRTLVHSADIATLRHQYPDNPALHELSDDTRIVVSEPLGGLRGAWREVPESSCVVIRGGGEQILPFTAMAPRAAA